MSNNTKEDKDNLQIMQHIQKQIQQAALSQPKHTSRNAQRTYPTKPADIPYNLTMYTYLETTKNLIPKFSTALEHKPNSITKLPIIGKIVQIVQIQLHQVAVFYTNRALFHEQEVHEHLIACLEELTIETQKQQRMISQLQEQIYGLQKEPTT